MENELDQEVIKLTQTSLGKYVKRPPLSDKLLKKPPFRFLHDIITTVLRTTGFFEGLFEEDELISDNVKDREGKILFLTKAISVLGLASGQKLSVKPSKVVAGQEPEKTNELLQCLAQALDKKLSSDEAVKKFKEKANAPLTTEKKPKESLKPVKKTNDPKKLISKSTEKLISQKRDSTDRLPRNEKDKANDIKPKKKEIVSNKSENTKKTQPLKTSSKRPQVENKSATKEEHKTASKEEIKIEKLNNANIQVSDDQQANIAEFDEIKSPEPPHSENKEVIEVNKALHEEQLRKPDQDEQGKLDLSFTIADTDLNSSLSSQDLMETDKAGNSNNIEKEVNTNNEAIFNNEILHNEKNIDLKYPNQTESLKIIKKTLKKDSSASVSFESDTIIKSGEPTIPSDTITNSIKSKTNSIRPPSVRPSSSRPGAPRLREKLDNIVTDSDNLLLGKVNIIVESERNEEEEDTSVIIVDKPTDTTTLQDQQQYQLSSNDHGHLVQQILDSQKDFSQVLGKTEIEWQFGAQKAREALNQELEQLRFNIQALSRVANPLGKLLDHIQEDVEVMRQELQQWSNIYEQVSKEIHKQKTINEDSLFPLHTKLKQIGADIEEKHDKINDLKILIHKNSSRIEKLLASGNVQ